MRYLCTVTIFAMILMLVTSLAFATDINKGTKDKVYLFSLAAKSGTFNGEKLVLNEVPQVVYFTDRPVRQSGHITLNKFIDMWDRGVDSFKLDPPTAQLSVYDEDGDLHDVMIISSPIVKGDSVSFKVKELEEKDNIPLSFEHATLFIDPLGMIFPSNRN